MFAISWSTSAKRSGRAEAEARRRTKLDAGRAGWASGADGGAAEHLDGDRGGFGRGAPDAHALGFKACALAAAVPAEPDTIAPAWPICLPAGAVKPAM